MGTPPRRKGPGCTGTIEKRSQGPRGPQAEYKEATKGSGKPFGPEASKTGFI